VNRLDFAATVKAIFVFLPICRIKRKNISSCSACGHPLQDLTHLLLDCPAPEALRRAIFGTTSSIFYLWFRPWGVGSLRSSSTPPSLGRGRVEPPPHHLIGKLPYDLWKRYVRKAFEIENSYRQLTDFSQFVEFVQCTHRESEEVNSLFGLRSLHPKSATSTPYLNKIRTSIGTVTTKFASNATGTKPFSKATSSNKSASKPVSKFFNQSGYCWFCKDTSHTLFDCKGFKDKPVQGRISFVKDAKLCHKCLMQGTEHRIEQRKVTVLSCSVDDL